jgi:putative integral membrane protein (TIGR02587 family)
MLMTMEMWWLGFYLSAERILLLIVVFFPVLVGVAHYIGFDDTESFGHAALHAITAYGVAVTSSIVMLGIFGVLKPGMGWHELVGKAAIQAGPGALGALMAQSHFGASEDTERRRRDPAYVEHLFFMVVGALFVALTVAPTDEMPMIGFMMRQAHTFVAVVFSLLVLYFFMRGVGFGFEGHAAAEPSGGLSTFFRLAVVGYALALAVSAFLLYVFGRYDGTQTAPAIHATVVLALPASVGAAAARLILDA